MISNRRLRQRIWFESDHHIREISTPPNILGHKCDFKIDIDQRSPSFTKAISGGIVGGKMATGSANNGFKSANLF